jgi:hypothetical protein
MPARDNADAEMKLVELELVGEFVAKINALIHFRRGVSALALSTTGIWKAKGQLDSRCGFLRSTHVNRGDVSAARRDRPSGKRSFFATLDRLLRAESPAS